MPPGAIVLTGAGATFPPSYTTIGLSPITLEIQRLLLRTAPLVVAKGFVVLSERTSQKKKRSISALVIPPCLTRNWSVPIIMH